ncbi:serine racemase-like isoform X1 [Oratosquilla oratoria]|uniref:serine racemase-like isoform X1 n=2 Tax=Oratosquilla oratoria TaxID=337810 RepID=UPI003F7686D6
MPLNHLILLLPLSRDFGTHGLLNQWVVLRATNVGKLGLLILHDVRLESRRSSLGSRLDQGGEFNMAGVKLKDIQAAANRIQNFVHYTPVMTNSTLDAIAGRQLFFKTENLQKTGSFKARGACNAVFLAKERKSDVPGVVTHSSGNHGQAVAYAAKCAGLPCSVVVPKGTPKVKCEAIQGYGANLVFCAPTPTDRKETCAKIAAETGKVIIHPFDDYNVIAGQGTIALELLEQVPDLDAILVPISGGGMTSGIAVATKSINPKCKVYPVEPKGKELQMCLENKKRLWPNPPAFLSTIADAIRTQQVGDLTFPILCDFAESVVFSVDDDGMVRGMRLVWERMKLVVEAASGAAVFAAIESLKKLDEAASLQKIGVILCGGNVDLDQLPWIHKSTTY